MMNEARPTSPATLPYESWLLRYEELAINHARTHAQDALTEELRPSGTTDGARELMLFALSPQLFYDAPYDPVDNPELPATIAEVEAEQQAASDLLGWLFAALLSSGVDLTVYTSATRYDPEGFADLLAPLAVAVLAGPSNYHGRKVLYEGQWPLKRLVAADEDQLRALHERLRSSVELEWMVYPR